MLKCTSKAMLALITGGLLLSCHLYAPAKMNWSMKTCTYAENFTSSEFDTCPRMLHGLPANTWWLSLVSIMKDTFTDDYTPNWNCDCFRLPDINVAKEELDFPLAFSLLTHENIVQTVRLLRLIYRPHNFYCLHVDAKSPPVMHRTAERVAFCLENVVVASPPVTVTWADVTVLTAELMCARKLLELGAGWKYFINLVGRDFPLRTNLELVRILNAYNGSNDVEFAEAVGEVNITKRREWYLYSWTDGKKTNKFRASTKPPHGLRLVKGSTHVAVTRQFLQYAVHNQTAIDLLNFISDLHVPDEHFYSTLHHNPKFNIPGAFTGDDPSSKNCLTRAKRWSQTTTPGQPDDRCRGRWIRDVCNVGAGDLPWIVSSPMFFLNKIRLEDSRMVYRCLELWFISRLRQPGTDLSTDSGKSRFDLEYYRKQPFVTQHV